VVYKQVSKIEDAPVGGLSKNSLFKGYAKQYFEANGWMQNAPVFSSAKKAIAWLKENRPADEKNSLGYLMEVLWHGGKIPEDRLMEWRIDASAADYFDKNAWIGCAPEFIDVEKSIKWLNENKPADEKNSLSYLMQALWHGKKIPEDKRITFGRCADAMRYLDEHEWIRKAPEFGSAREAIEWMRANQPAKEERTLGTLMISLWFGGKISADKLSEWQWEAGAAEYFYANKWMQEAPVFEDVNSTIAWIGKNRKNKNRGLTTLMSSMRYGMKIPEDEAEKFQRHAGAADYFKKSKWIQNAPKFIDVKKAIAWLRENAPETEKKSLDVLMRSMWHGKKIPKNKCEEFCRNASALEYFDRNGWMHGAPKFTEIKKLLAWLKENKPETETNSSSNMILALYHGNKVPEDKLMMLTISANAAEYFEKNEWMQKAPEFYELEKIVVWLKENRPIEKTLFSMEIPGGHDKWDGRVKRIVNGRKYEFMVEKEEIAALIDGEPVTTSGFVIEKNGAALDVRKEMKSLSYLTLALWHGDKMPKKKLMNWQMRAGCAEYAIKNKEQFVDEIANAAKRVITYDLEDNARFFKAVKSKIDRTKFTYLRDKKLKGEKKHISERYFRDSYKWAILFYTPEIIERLEK